MTDLNMVFWQDEEELQEKNPLKLLLCCNASQNEDWLKSQLPDFDEAGRAKNVPELRKTLKANETIHLAIIMRKTGSNGVDKPEDFAKIIREHSPDAQIFIIVGKKDERGSEIVEKTELYDCRTLTAENGSIKAIDILQEVEYLANIAREKFKKEQDLVQENMLKVVVVEGVKGGCGETTAMVILAKMLKNQGEEVSLLDKSGGCKYLGNPDLDHLTIGVDSLPEEGWLIIEEKMVDLDYKHDLVHILVSDSSTESLARAKERLLESPNSLIIINRTEPDVLPNEIYKGEFGRSPDLVVPYRAAQYLVFDWDVIIKDWQPLLHQLLEMR